ncbi:MAG TPA: DUF3486 family protein [Azospirillum sp.]|nr:DUF3486 family protein [Azospirillum sp.]
MAARSSIDRLPKEIREAIGQLRQDGATIDEILAHLRGMQVDVSRSAVGRHVQKIEKIGAQLRETREAAEALVRELGDEPDSKVARLNIELGHAMLMRLLAGKDGEPVQLDAQEANFAAGAIQKLTSARKTDADLVLKLQAEADKKALATLEAVGKKKGLSADMVKAIKEDFLGIRKAAA